MRNTVSLFFFTRLFLIISFFIVTLYIPYSGFFPYGEIAKAYHLPDILTKLANFDGVHYLSIAKEGYHNYDQAYFPLYPLVIHLLGPLFMGNLLITAIVISNISLLGVLWIGKSFFNQVLSKSNSTWFLVFFLSFPTAFFLSTVYTESFFLLFFLLSVYFFHSKKFVLAFVMAALSALTRLNGLFLSVIFLTVVGVLWYKKKKIFFSKEIILQLFSSLGSLVGFGIYSLYLYVTTGDPLFFFHAQPVFGANRSTHLIFLPQVIYRYIKIFITSAYNFQLFVSYIEFIFFIISFSLCLYFLYWIYKSGIYSKYPILLGLGFFSLITIILPTLTGTFSSLPRYCLLSLCIFLPLAHIQNTAVKISLVILFFLLQVVLFGFFVQGYFIS